MEEPSMKLILTISCHFRSGECISNAERFYVILSNLLMKRGKKDFAIRINYRCVSIILAELRIRWV